MVVLNCFSWFGIFHTSFDLLSHIPDCGYESAGQREIKIKLV